MKASRVKNSAAGLLWVARNTYAYPGAAAYVVPQEDGDSPNTVQHCVAINVPIGFIFISAEGTSEGYPTLPNLTFILPKVAGDNTTVLYNGYGALGASTSVPSSYVPIRNSLFINLDDQLNRWGRKRVMVSAQFASDYCAYWSPHANVEDFEWAPASLGGNDYSEQDTPDSSLTTSPLWLARIVYSPKVLGFVAVGRLGTTRLQPELHALRIGKIAQERFVPRRQALQDAQHKNRHPVAHGNLDLRQAVGDGQGANQTPQRGSRAETDNGSTSQLSMSAMKLLRFS